MGSQAVKRRLAAILSADVVGYSRLMGEDEAGTLERLKAHRAECVDPAIAQRGGRLVKLMGDGALVEFASVVDAVECAIAVQRGMAKRNADVPEDKRIVFRIGINLGDIIIEGDDIYGDGVNVAARIQEIAEAGGVALSDSAYQQVEGKIEAGFEDDGEHDLKNIAKPVRVYHWVEGAVAPAVEAAALALPDKPSIAVLPFNNMSGDPEQEYFSDGITEDIITELSRFPTLFVIARNSSFVFRGKAVDITEIGKKLGVQYVVEGSVRKAGNRVRITAQLVETASGNHLWAERYDRDLEDIFAVQDEVAQTIVSTVAGRLDHSIAEGAKRRPPGSLAAHDYYLRAMQHLHHYTTTDMAAARPLLEKAIELDPSMARAHAVLAMVDIFDWWLDPGDHEALERASNEAQRALALDDSDARSHFIFGQVCLQSGRHFEALTHMETAVDLNPNEPLNVSLKGYYLSCLGRHEEGLEWVERAMRLDPFVPDWLLELHGMILYALGRYEDAVTAFTKMTAPPFWVHRYVAACYGQLGRPDEARRAVALYNDAFDRGRRAGHVSAYSPMTTLDVHYKEEADREHFREGFRKAGFEV